MRWQPLALAAVMMLSGAEQPDAIPTQAARIILEAQDSTNQVWPGFSLPARSFAIYTSAGTYLHTPGAAPEGFVRQGRLYYRPGRLPGFEGVLATALPLGDLRVTIIGAGRTAEATAETLYHEAFHAFQQEAMLSTAAALDAGSLSITAEQAASIEVERRLLREALQQRQAPQASLIDALAVRRTRAANGGESLAPAERIVERHEGLAEYVALMSMARALKRTPLTARAVVARSLELPLKTFGGSPDERLVRTRGYATGAAMAMLLDDLTPGWRFDAGDTPLDELAAAAVSFPAARTAELAAAALARHGFDKLRRDTDPPWGSLSVMTEQEFNALAPYRVVVETSATAKPSFNFSAGSDAAQGMHRPRPGVLMLPAPARFSIEDGPLTIAVTGRPVRVDRPAEASSAVVTVLLRQAPTVNGGVAPKSDQSLPSLELVADGVRITSTTPVRIMIEANVLKVTREPLPAR